MATETGSPTPTPQTDGHTRFGGTDDARSTRTDLCDASEEREYWDYSGQNRDPKDRPHAVGVAGIVNDPVPVPNTRKLRAAAGNTKAVSVSAGTVVSARWLTRM